MKVKLLKKLRKRFHWYMDGQNCWYFYDIKYNEIEYAYISGMRGINDMLILMLLRRIGLECIYEPRHEISGKRKKERDDLKRKQYFAQFFQAE